jgi:hypothetical protein
MAMFTLADKYNIKELKVLLVNKYLEYLAKNLNVSNFLLLIPKVYNSISPSIRGLCNCTLAFTREKLLRFLSLSNAKEKSNKVTTNSPEFIKELLYYFIDYWLLGYYGNYSGYK